MPSSPRGPEIFLLAGEASGDARGAELARALQKRDPSLKLTAMGGPLLKAAGVEVIEDITADAVVGIFESVRRYPFFKRVFDRLLGECVSRRPAAIVGVDFPGFNLRFERAARKRLGRGPLIAQYVSPQLWAWGENRKHRMARFLDLVLCIFPFEPRVYEGTGLKAEYVGHPLTATLHSTDTPSRDSNLVALFPGSRQREIKYHWPVFRETAARLKERVPAIRFAVGSSTGGAFDDFEVVDPGRLMQSAQAGLVASGTATLEACMHGLPFLAVYKVSPPTYWLGKALVKVPHLAMPNVIAGRRIVPEFVQQHCRAEELTPALEDLLQSGSVRRQMRADFSEVRSLLGTKNAANSAAALIVERLPIVKERA